MAWFRSNIRWFYWPSFFVLLAWLFLLPKPLNAQISTSFEEYDPDLSLVGQYGWTYLAESNDLGLASIMSEAYQGFNLVYNTTSGRSAAYVAFASSTNTISQCFALRANTVSGITLVGLYQGTSLRGQILLTNADPDGVYIYYGTGNVRQWHDLDNNWHEFCIRVNSVSDKVQYEYNASTTAWINQGTYAGTYVDRFVIYLVDNINLDYLNSTSTPNESLVLDEMELDPSISTISPDFATVSGQLCFVNQSCELWFSINEYDLGAIMYLIPHGEVNNPSNAVSSTTIIYDVLGQNYIDLPIQTTATTVKYDLLMDVPDYGYVIRTNISVNWIASSTLDDVFTTYDIEHICDDISTSTYSWWDITAYPAAMTYAIQCGGRKLSYWAFTPTDDIWTEFIQTKNDFDNNFPINFIYQMKDFIVDLRNATSAPASFIITGLSSTTALANLNGVDLLPLDQLSGDTVEPLVDIFRDIQTWILYLMLGLFFVWQFLKMIGASWERKDDRVDTRIVEKTKV